MSKYYETSADNGIRRIIQQLQRFNVYTTLCLLLLPRLLSVQISRNHKC